MSHSLTLAFTSTTSTSASALVIFAACDLCCQREGEAAVFANECG